MSDASKDSPEVVEFMALFSRLKDWSDDDPEGLFGNLPIFNGVQP